MRAAKPVPVAWTLATLGVLGVLHGQDTGETAGSGRAVSRSDPDPTAPMAGADERRQESDPAPAPAAGYRRFVTELFAVDVPEGWREVLPNESVTLDLPPDFPPVRPGWSHVLGDVDRWARDGYDGEALLAMVAGEFEAPTDQERLDEIREYWATTQLADGGRREVVRGRVTTVGRTDHPCLELEVRTIPADGRVERCLEFQTSTRGRELILSFRAWEDDFPVAEPRLRTMAETLTFPRPPRTQEGLGDRLFDAALVGGAVGLILIGLRYIARRRGPGG